MISGAAGPLGVTQDEEADPVKSAEGTLQKEHRTYQFQYVSNLAIVVITDVLLSDND